MADGKFGELLRQVREERELSMSAAARELKVAVSNYRSWEKGNHYPGVEHLAPVAIWLDLPLATLLRKSGLITRHEEQQLLALQRQEKGH